MDLTIEEFNGLIATASRQSLADTNSIPFNKPLTIVAAHTMSGARTYTPNTTGQSPYNVTVHHIIADGTNVPDLTAFTKDANSKDYKNVNTVDNELIFWYTGSIHKYMVRLRAIDMLTQLATPGSFTATASSDTIIGLSWANISNESSFKLEYSLDGTTGWTQIGGTIAANTLSYSHTGLTASTTYYYRLKAIGDGITYSDSALTTANDTTDAASSYDADAQAYFTAMETDASPVTLPTLEKDLWNDEVISRKADGRWVKDKALYPMMGGTASSCKWNAKDPRDLDAAYRLTFHGSWTFGPNGAQPNGVNAYARTYLGDNIMSQNSIHISYYSRTNTTVGGAGAVNIGTQDGAGSVYCNIYQKYTTGDVFGTMNGDGTAYATLAAASGANYTIANRNDSSNNRIVVNGTAASVAASSFTPSGQLFFLGAMNQNGTPIQFSPAECALACIGDGYTPTQETNDTTSVNTLQTGLSRNVF